MAVVYLESTRDKVEIILQWIQRSIARLEVLRMNDGVLPVAPPVLSRAFQAKLAFMPFWCSVLLSKTMAIATSFVETWQPWWITALSSAIPSMMATEAVNPAPLRVRDCSFIL
eukprot:Skav232560  [mRNA]  locus=scaffold3309:92488:96800:- [translate_table: standard]